MFSSPIPVWFVCKSCEDSFTLMSRFIDHKKDKHFSEFQNIKFIVFEETTRDQNENQDPTQESTQESESSIDKEKLAFIESIPVPLPKLRLVKRNSELFHIVDKAPVPEPEQIYLPSTTNLSSPSHGEDDFIGGTPVTVTPTTPPPFLPDLLLDEQDVHLMKTEGGLENSNETEKNNMTGDLFHSAEFLQHIDVDLATDLGILDSNNAITEIDSDAVFDFQGGLIFQKSTFDRNTDSLGNSGENDDEVIPYSTSTSSSIISVLGDDGDSDSDNDPHLDPALQPITELIIYAGENPDAEAADPLQEISANTIPNNLPLPLKVKKLTNSKTKLNAKNASNKKAKVTNTNKHIHNHNPFVFLTRLTSKQIQDFASRIQNVKRNQNRPKKLLPLKPKPKLIPNPQFFGCKFCSKKYKRQPRLKMHIKICKSRNKTSSKAKQKPKSQPKRPRRRKSKSALKVKVANQPKHKISSDPTNPLLVPISTFAPMIASKIVQTSGGANVVQKSYICSICQQVCSGLTTLRNHFATHSDLRPFSCAQLNCEKAFKTRKSLYSHENQVHSGTKVFICPQKGCSKSFPARKLLIRHRSSQHRGKIQEASRINKKKKKCLDKTQCKTKTELSSSKTKILTMPLPKRPAGYPRGLVPESFKCHICNREFPWKAYLRNHLRLMHSTTSQKSQKDKHSNSHGQGDRSTTTSTSSAAGKRKRKSVVRVDV